MSANNTAGFNTRAVHAGQEFEPRTGAVVPPLHFSTTYAQDGIGGLRSGYEYGRGGNPTRDALQEQLAALEGGTAAFSFGSGLAAEDSLIRAIARPRDHIVLGNDAYGGTYRLINRVLGDWGIGNTPVDMSDLDAVARAVAANKTRIVWVETPSNPMMKITDIAALAEVAHDAGALLVVDNTFASPYLQTPLALGADVVVHSTTKYIGGHSDVVGGAIVVKDADLAEKIGFIQFAVGAVSGPMDAFLTTRGLKTLGVRMDRHSENGQAVAEWLLQRPEVEAVLYPGLADHPGHDLAAKQMKKFGGMVSVQFKGGEAAARKVAESTSVFTLAESLGGIESLMNYPSEMTHASVKGTELAVPVNLLRLSCGIEDAEDLIADLEQAFAKISNG
ncbi:cystathionine gamma-synthase [Paenarthrobacter ureafaciens]|uniref:cystathionine gamma-synthase n=1 Tax=Paenarthrobacter ureafaciens TaxID=37931 RepID=UPI0008A6C976|nr:cystathionine gamma-synthase [Paenarthrobacter ureafaciens]AOY70206.1 cystathionine gamma-synthase [Arthrobacter sp. ZXY-2]GLU58540.1 cystathionine gamma-synthase [Paenarthrobacter ureafaciens]GLU61785.1 cystathionine gamma-synthase [Paenarthrobacter ureafaciens]GLU66059.1 cystathionine gamma-synthase [Paenarthrobacter ureafaciens]GLU71617.1 cystathionine gamma-synthase [Paenarthrobacter ureafaciens]